MRVVGGELEPLGVYLNGLLTGPIFGVAGLADGSELRPGTGFWVGKLAASVAVAIGTSVPCRMFGGAIAVAFGDMSAGGVTGGGPRRVIRSTRPSGLGGGGPRGVIGSTRPLGLAGGGPVGVPGNKSLSVEPAGRDPVGVVGPATELADGPVCVRDRFAMDMSLRPQLMWKRAEANKSNPAFNHIVYNL